MSTTDVGASSRYSLSCEGHCVLLSKSYRNFKEQLLDEARGKEHASCLSPNRGASFSCSKAI